jgi:ribose transport system permease protein
MSQTASLGHKAQFGALSLLHTAWGKALLATLLLLIIGGVVAPTSLSTTSVLSMLPFAAMLGVAATGQHLVVQQRGLDLSVAGVISLSAVLITLLPGVNAGGATVAAYVILVVAVGALIGAANGVFATWVHLPPLVATIGVNAVVIGVALTASGGVPSKAPTVLSQIAIGRTVGIPNTIFVVVLSTLLAVTFLATTQWGRKFVAIAANAGTAHALGMPVVRYQIGTYVAAGILYAIAGVLLAGFLSTPGLFLGNDYILWTVAAVVVGTNSIAGGGKGSVLATVIGAFFLTYLSQLVLAMGFDRSIQQITEAAIIICGVALTGFLNAGRAR